MAVVYAEYIASPAWRAKRLQVFRSIIPNRCYCCNRKRSDRRPFEIHHIRYDNLGNEPLADLVMVCLICHGLIHNYAMATLGMALAAATEHIKSLRSGKTRKPVGIGILRRSTPDRPHIKAAKRARQRNL